MENKLENKLENQYSRTQLIYGKAVTEKLKDFRVAVFGLGGVGSYVVEALSRFGVGTLDLIDYDKINLSNINRQIFALHSTLGLYKTTVAKERVLDINPDICVNIYNVFFSPENVSFFDFSAFDYVVDAIDNVSGKISLVLESQKVGVPIISSMGMANKKNPSAIKTGDIFNTSVCPLARIMRTELKKRGVKNLRVVYSEERPARYNEKNLSEVDAADKKALGSNSFVPATAGLIIASEVINYLVSDLLT